MLRLSDLIRQGVVSHPGHAMLGGSILARRKMRPFGMSSQRLKIKKKKKKKDLKKLADIISIALDDKDARRPHGSQKTELRLHDIDFPEFKGKDVRKVLGSPEGVRRIIDRHLTPPGSPKRKKRFENAKQDLSHGRLSDAAIKKLLVPHVRVVGKKRKPEDEVVSDPKRLKATTLKRLRDEPEVVSDRPQKRTRTFHEETMDRIKADEKEPEPWDEPSVIPSRVRHVKPLPPLPDEEPPMSRAARPVAPRGFHGVPPPPPIPEPEPPKLGISTGPETVIQSEPPKLGISTGPETVISPEPAKLGISTGPETVISPEPKLGISTGPETVIESEPKLDIVQQEPVSVPPEIIPDPPEKMDIEPEPVVVPPQIKPELSVVTGPELTIPDEPAPRVPSPKQLSVGPGPTTIIAGAPSQPPVPPAKKEDEPVVGMDIDSENEEEATVKLPPAKVTTEIQTQTEPTAVALGPSVEAKPAPMKMAETKPATKLDVVTGPKVAIAAKRKPIPPEKKPAETGKKFPELEKLTKRLAALESKPSYKPRVQPTIIRGPAGPAGPAGAAGASSSSSSAAAGGPSSGGQKQKQQIIIARGRRRKKAPSELSKLKKEYTAKRKVVFKHVVKTKKERIKKFTEQVKISTSTKTEKRKAIIQYRNKVKIAHETYRKMFPIAKKITDISTLKSLIGKLSKPSF